jgi:tetratricopeptide (TPR) repeat protein
VNRTSNPKKVIAMTSFVSAYLLPLLVLIAASGNGRSQAQPDLARLQNDLAVRYFEAAPHMALTKYYLSRGDRREAFFVLETARRGILEEAVFDRAFQVEFEGFDTSKTAEEKLLSQLRQQPHSADLQFRLADIYISRSDYEKATDLLDPALKEHPEDYRFTAGLAGILDIQGKTAEAKRLVADYTRKYPESAEAYEIRADSLHKTSPRSAQSLLEKAVAKYPDNGDLIFKLGLTLQEAGNLDKAEAAFVKAAALAPKSVTIQSWVGRFFFKVRKDEARALPYYLNAYFLSPHAYETEYVESRIRNIYFAQAQASFQNLRTKPLTDLLNDQNPQIVALALEQMEKTWKPVYLDPVTALLGHEDQGVRWDATQLLKNKADASFDPTLRALLKDNDLRKRGLAAYIAVYRWKDASFQLMDELLADNAELLRYDALSALILEGGAAGKQHALAHASREKHPMLRKLLENARQKKTEP